MNRLGLDVIADVRFVYESRRAIDLQKGDTIRRGTIVGRIANEPVVLTTVVRFDLAWHGGTMTMSIPISAFVSVTTESTNVH